MTKTATVAVAVTGRICEGLHCRDTERARGRAREWLFALFAAIGWILVVHLLTVAALDACWFYGLAAAPLVSALGIPTRFTMGL